jgi:hypothetical protein
MPLPAMLFIPGEPWSQCTLHNFPETMLRMVLQKNFCLDSFFRQLQQESVLRVQWPGTSNFPIEALLHTRAHAVWYTPVQTGLGDAPRQAMQKS